MDPIIICVALALTVVINIAVALFGGTTAIVCVIARHQQIAQERRREHIKELRKRKVYDNYLTRFGSRG